jgi:hypothetical protein
MGDSRKWAAEQEEKEANERAEREWHRRIAMFADKYTPLALLRELQYLKQQVDQLDPNEMRLTAVERTRFEAIRQKLNQLIP